MSIWYGAVEPTWTRGRRRTLLRRAQWGLLVGAAEVFSGAVSVLSLGQFASNLPLNVAFALTVRESRCGRDEEAAVNQG